MSNKKNQKPKTSVADKTTANKTPVAKLTGKDLKKLKGGASAQCCTMNTGTWTARSSAS